MNRQLAESLVDEVADKEVSIPSAKREAPIVLLVSVITLFALLLRLDLLIHTNFVVDADEAIVGLMAQHMVKGGDVPTFYYGQHYMGSMEPILSSFVFYLFGSSPLTLKVVPLIFALMLVPLTYVLGKRVGGKSVGLLAALFVALPPAAFLEWSTKARGGFIEIVVISTLCLILATRWLEGRSLGLTASIAALLGLGWWTNNQIIFTILPVGLFFTLSIFSSKRDLLSNLREYSSHLAVGGFSFFIGGLPFWIYNLQNNFVSFQMFGGSAERWDNLKGFFRSALPILLGGKRFWHSEDYFYGSSLLTFLLFGVILSIILSRRRQAIVRLVTFRGVEGVELLLVFLSTTASVFVLSSFGSLYTAPRYLLPAYPALYVLTGFAISKVWRRRWLSFLLGASVLFFNLASYYWGGRSIPGEPVVFQGERVQREHGPLLQWLHDHDYHWIRTNYWIGYRVAFETAEDVKFLIFQPPHQTRLPEYEREGSTLPLSKTPFVLTPLQSPSVERGLSALGYIFEKAIVGGYHVVHGIRSLDDAPPTTIPSNELQVHATHKNEDADGIIDGDISTRWGSGAPQAANMAVTVSFADGRAHTVRGIKLELGNFKTDFARALSVKCVKGDNKIELLSAAAYLDILFVLEGKPLEVQFVPQQCEKLELVQEGSDTFFDWSIAELTVFE